MSEIYLDVENIEASGHDIDTILMHEFIHCIQYYNYDVVGWSQDDWHGDSFCTIGKNLGFRMEAYDFEYFEAKT